MLLLIILATGLVTITWLSLLSLYISKENARIENLKLSVKLKNLAYKRESLIDPKSFINAINARNAISLGADVEPAELPEELRLLMSQSPNHEEIQEIDSSDQLIGVFFDSKYPPEFS